MYDNGPIKSLYLAGPIDAVTAEEAKDWQDQLAGYIPGVAMFSPAHPYKNAAFEHAKFIDECNRAAIMAAGGLIANLPEGRPAFGTIREIEYAVQLRKPVIVVGSWIKSFLVYDLKVVGRLAGVVDAIDEINAERASRYQTVAY